MTSGINTLIYEHNVSYSPGGGKAPYCVSDKVSGSAFPSLDGEIVDERSPVVHGDRVHALPYYRTIIGELVVTGDLSVKSQVGRFPPNHGCTGKIAPETYDGSVWGGSLAPNITLGHRFPDPSTMEDMVAIATTKALANARRSFNNLPLLIAERRQTVQLIGTLLRRLNLKTLVTQRESILRYLRTAHSRRKQVARDIAGEHLAFLFGVLPLVQEIEGLVEQLAASKSAVITGRGRMAFDDPSFEASYDRAVRVSVPGVNLDVPVTIRPEKHTRHSARVSLRYAIDIEGLQGLRDNGFNPIATAYDLIPLSFLSDFVSNTGQWLRAYDPMFGATFVTGSISTWFEWREGYELAGSSIGSPANWFRNWTESVGSCHVYRSGKRMVRTVLSSEPDPSWRMVNTVTLAKAVTGVSLAVQRFVKPTKAAIKQRPFRYKGPRPKYLPKVRYRKTPI